MKRHRKIIKERRENIEYRILKDVERIIKTDSISEVSAAKRAKCCTAAMTK